MKVRIGNDIRINLTIKGPKEYTYTNVKQIKCLIINECLGDCGCDCECGRCPIERRFPMEPFPLYYTPTPWTLNACGKARYHTDPWNCKADYCVFAPHFHDYHWWPGYRGFGECPKKFIGDCCRFHMNHAMDIFYCNGEPHCHHGHCKPCPPCPCPCPCGDKDFVYCAKVEFLEEPNRVSCIFPAYDQIMLGSYKVVLIVTTYELGWGCRNLHTETIDYGTAFELVDTEEGESGYIVIDLDNPEPGPEPGVKPKMWFEDIVEEGEPLFHLSSGHVFHYNDDDDYPGNTYLLYAGTTDGKTVKPKSTTNEWENAGYGKLIYTSSNPNVISFESDGNVSTIIAGNVQQDTTVAITITEENNKLQPLTFTIVVFKLVGPTPPQTPVVQSITVSNLSDDPVAHLGDTITYKYEIAGQNLTGGATIICNDRTITPIVTYTTNTSSSKIATFDIRPIDYLSRSENTLDITVIANDDTTKTADADTVDIIVTPLILNAYYGANIYTDEVMGTIVQSANRTVNMSCDLFIAPQTESKFIDIAIGNVHLLNYNQNYHSIKAIVRRYKNGATYPTVGPVTIPLNQSAVDYDNNILTTFDIKDAPTDLSSDAVRMVIDIVCTDLYSAESTTLLTVTICFHNTYDLHYQLKPFTMGSYDTGTFRNDIDYEHIDSSDEDEMITVGAIEFNSENPYPTLSSIETSGTPNGPFHYGPLQGKLVPAGDFELDESWGGGSTLVHTYKYETDDYIPYYGMKLYPVFVLNGSPDDGDTEITGLAVLISNYPDRTKNWDVWSEMFDEIAHDHSDTEIYAIMPDA